jgi:hypothetical protein
MTRRGRKKKKGNCNICGKYGPMSFEHVPNQAAYNKRTVIEYSWESEFIHKEKSKGKITQGGIGAYTLCEKCNNDTGHWYGGEYTKWAHICYDFLENRKLSNQEPDEAIITLHNVYPLRFLKQVVVCFFTVTPGLAQTHPSLVQYVLNKEERLLSKDCRFYINFYYGPNPKLRRWPFAAKLTVSYINGKITPLSGSIISEFTHPPFSIQMSDSSGFYDAGEITVFTKYNYYQQIKDLTLKLRVLKGTSTLPGSFE